MRSFSKAVFLVLAAPASAGSAAYREPSSKSENTPEPTKKPTNSDRSPSSSISSKSTKKPTKEPTNRSSVSSSTSSSKSTKKPTRRPTRKPTKKPTSSSNSRDGRDDCVDKENPRPVRSGQRFRFKLQGSNAQCVDKNDDLYEWGQFDKIKEFSDCADACVEGVRSELLDSLRGYDWNCYDEKCRCLYDKGTLESSDGKDFDRTNRNEYGKGTIEGTTKNTDYYCAKLAGTEFDVAGTNFDVAEDSRALRGYN